MSLKPPFLSLLTSVTAVFNMGLMPAPRNVVLIELTTDDDCFVYGYSLPSSSSTVNIPIVLKKSSSRSIPSQEELAILHLPFPEAITFRSILFPFSMRHRFSIRFCLLAFIAARHPDAPAPITHISNSFISDIISPLNYQDRKNKLTVRPALFN